ncbi:MAG: D-2-hydroxyacid dehydrogenase [Oscillospiraceae bacterium]|nr:D-2-hydroxyacid dehydrogenase [Oscillospiraceae bacterium]
MKIVILDGHCLNPGDLSWSGFESMGAVTVYDRTPLEDTDEIVRRIADCDIVLTNKTPITREILERCPGIRYIGVLATGYNVVDTQAAAERKIPVCNVPGYGTEAVAQFAIALLLEVCSRVGSHDRAVHEGQWSACPDYCFWNAPLVELAGKTMGIIGYGRIGRAVGRIAAAMGMEVIAYGPHPWTEGEAAYTPLEELLYRSDVVSLHCPMTPQTERLINRDAIAKMKDGAILINNSRGQLLSEQDVADALASGKLAAAAVDVAETEPVPAGSPLLTAPNCIITPHISWAAQETRQRLLDIAVENLRAFTAGRPVHVVNMSE